MQVSKIFVRPLLANHPEPFCKQLDSLVIVAVLDGGLQEVWVNSITPKQV